MQGDVLRTERDFLVWGLQQSPVPHQKFVSLCPDFLIISPPKTGSTWLADNLRCHPEVFVPAIKEVKYFSSYFKSLDLGWYLGHFAVGAGRSRAKRRPPTPCSPPNGSG